MNPGRRHALAALAAFASGVRPLLAADARPARRVALLSLDAHEGFAPRLEAFKAAMQKLGHREGRGIAYEIHMAGGDLEKLASLAQSVAGEPPSVVVSDSAQATLALRKASATLPIVMVACDDPVASRFVRSLEKPGTNVTGLTAFVRDETPRFAEWIARFVPRGAPVAGIFNPGSATYRKHRAGFHIGALKTGLAPLYLDAVNAGQIDEAFAAAAQEKAAGFIVMNDAMFLAQRRRFVQLAAKAGKPALFPTREFVRDGGLMSFGPNLEQNFRGAARFVDRILAGANPAELPVEGIRAYELALNRRTAAALKLQFPESMVKRAYLVG